MKKILVLLVCLLLTGCIDKANTQIEDKPKENEQQSNIEDKGISDLKEEYEALNEKSVNLTIDLNAKVKYLKEEEVLDFFDNKTGIIYFGFPSCPWCRNILPILLNLAIDNDETVYYINPRNLSDEYYEKIKNHLLDYLQTDKKGNKVLYVPDVYFIKDGNIKGHYLGSVSSQSDPYEPLDDNQKQELYNIYNELYGKIK